MRWMKTVALTAALSTAGLCLPATAQAGHYGHGYYKPYKPVIVHKHRHRSGDALAAGIFGLAAGAIIAGALSRPRAPHYAYSGPVYGHSYAAPVYGGPAPWTPDWYAYCASKYRSFDPHSGTFQPYNGPRRLCQ